MNKLLGALKHHGQTFQSLILCYDNNRLGESKRIHSVSTFERTVVP